MFIEFHFINLLDKKYIDFPGIFNIFLPTKIICMQEAERTSMNINKVFAKDLEYQNYII